MGYRATRYQGYDDSESLKKGRKEAEMRFITIRRNRISCSKRGKVKGQDRKVRQQFRHLLDNLTRKNIGQKRRQQHLFLKKEEKSNRGNDLSLKRKEKQKEPSRRRCANPSKELAAKGKIWSSRECSRKHQGNKSKNKKKKQVPITGCPLRKWDRKDLDSERK